MGKSGKIAPSFKGKNILGEENAGIQLSRPTKKLCHHHPLTHHYSIYTLHTESRNYPCLNGRVGNSLFHTFALHYFALSLFALSLFALSLFNLSLFALSLFALSLPLHFKKERWELMASVTLFVKSDGRECCL